MHGNRLETLAVREQVVDAPGRAPLEVVRRKADRELALEPREIGEQRGALVLREDALEDRVAIALDAREMLADFVRFANRSTYFASAAAMVFCMALV